MQKVDVKNILNRLQRNLGEPFILFHFGETSSIPQLYLWFTKLPWRLGALISCLVLRAGLASLFLSFPISLRVCFLLVFRLEKKPSWWQLSVLPLSSFPETWLKKPQQWGNLSLKVPSLTKKERRVIKGMKCNERRQAETGRGHDCHRPYVS